MIAKFALFGLLLATCAGGAEAASTSGKYSVDIPEGWASRTKFDDPNVPLAVFAPKHADPNAFRENISIIMHEKGEGITLKSIAADQDRTAKKYRPDFTLSDEKEDKIGEMKCISRLCTMTFPDGVFKNRQYIVNAGDKIAIITASVPEARFKELDEAVVKVIVSFKVKK